MRQSGAGEVRDDGPLPAGIDRRHTHPVSPPSRMLARCPGEAIHAATVPSALKLPRARFSAARAAWQPFRIAVIERW